MAENQRPARPTDEFEKRKELDLYLERGTIVRENMRRINDLRSSAFQLANYYFVFQGVILAAFTSGTTALRSKDQWLLFSLSAIPALLNVCAIISIGIDYMKEVTEQDQYSASYKLLYRRIYEPQQPGNTAASTVDPNANIEFSPPPDHFKICVRQILLSICIILFLSFLVLTLIGCRTITGREDHHSNKNQLLVDNDKCASFCVAWWQEVGRSSQTLPPYP